MAGVSSGGIGAGGSVSGSSEGDAEGETEGVRVAAGVVLDIEVGEGEAAMVSRIELLAQPATAIATTRATQMRAARPPRDDRPIARSPHAMRIVPSLNVAPPTDPDQTCE